MKDPTLELAAAYFQILNPMTVEGTAIAYQTPMARNNPDSPRPLIMIESINILEQETDKLRANYLIEMNLEIQNEANETGPGTQSRVLELKISEEVSTRILGAAFENFMTDHKVITKIQANKEMLPIETFGGKLIFTTAVTFEHWIENL